MCYIATTDQFIQQAEKEIDEIAAALRKASGRVGESLEKQMHDANARYDRYIAQRAEIQKELGTRKLTDDAVQEIVTYAKDMRLGIDEADFETKRRMLELLDVQVRIEGDKLQISCVIVDRTSKCQNSTTNPARINF